jgi:hypothetical protein
MIYDLIGAIGGMIAIGLALLPFALIYYIFSNL